MNRDVVIMLEEISVGGNATSLLVSENNCGEENGDGSTKIRQKAYKIRLKNKTRPGAQRQRSYAQPPLPKQHQESRGLESEMPPGR